MSTSSLSAGQPGTSHGSVEVTGQDAAPPLPPSTEALASVLREVMGHSLTLRHLLVAHGEVEDQDQASAVLASAEAVVGRLGFLAEETLRALGETGMFSDALEWLAPHLRVPVRSLRKGRPVRPVGGNGEQA